MKKHIVIALLAVALSLPATAQTTVTGPNGTTATGAAWAGRFGRGRAGTVTGANGGTATGGGGVVYGPYGRGRFHAGTATAANGSTTTGAGGWIGNRYRGAAGSARTWNGVNSSGTHQGATVWNHGAVNSDGSTTYTNKQTGVTSTDSHDVNYNPATGGTATFTGPNGTKTTTLP